VVRRRTSDARRAPPEEAATLGRGILRESVQRAHAACIGPAAATPRNGPAGRLAVDRCQCMAAAVVAAGRRWLTASESGA
jgi:hypothetical protein